MIKPNRRRFAIAIYLLSGVTPWGRDLHRSFADSEQPSLPNCDGRWIMCCGHVMRTEEVEVWKADGLLVDGPVDRGNRPTVVAGPKLETWVSHAWHNMVVQRWWRHGDEQPAPYADELVH